MKRNKREKNNIVGLETTHMSFLNNENNNNNYTIATATTIAVLAIILVSTSIVTPAAATTTMTTTTSPEGNKTSSAAPLLSGIKLSSQPIYQESTPPGKVTLINQTHIGATHVGNGTLTLPNSNQTISTTSN